MIRSELLKIAAVRLKVILLVVSVYVLFRGHNQPGGGFVGGLLAGSAFILHGLAFGIEVTRRLPLMRPFRWMGLGLMMVIASGVIAVAGANGSFLQGAWMTVTLSGMNLKLGTPLLFDTGIYFAVAGMLMLVSSAIMEEG